jgi:ABC-type molybdate transport system permease subunit
MKTPPPDHTAIHDKFATASDSMLAIIPALGALSLAVGAGRGNAYIAFPIMLTMILYSGVCGIALIKRVKRSEPFGVFVLPISFSLLIAFYMGCHLTP